MRKKVTNNSVAATGVFGKFAADKKKTVAAVCLIVLMVFMWIRVLTRKPKTAGANNSVPVVNNTSMNNTSSSASPVVNVSFVELPRIKGRHDVLSRDFFSSNNWRSFNGDRGTGSGQFKVKVSAGDEIARRIATKLMVETIWIGSERQVVINDNLLSIGDKIKVKQGEEVYECEVVEIEDDRVLITFGESKIELSLIRTNEN